MPETDNCFYILNIGNNKRFTSLARCIHQEVFYYKLEKYHRTSEKRLRSLSELITLGWREWVGLNDLDIPAIKAKIDTGARTSALHAFEIEPFVESGVERIKFKIHPKQRNTEKVTTCVADIADQRDIRNSGGQLETRWVIQSVLTIATQSWLIDITLTSREDMRFRMLLGRQAMKNRVLVDPTRSYVNGKRRKQK